MTETQTVDLAAWLTSIWEQEKDALIEGGLHDPSECETCSLAAKLGDPAIALARIAAHRKILELHWQEFDDIGYAILGPYCAVCRYDDGLDKDPYPCDTLKALASPYKGREGWQESWGDD